MQVPAQPVPIPRQSKAGKYAAEEFAKAQQTAHGRLYPSILTSHYLVLRNRRIHMQEFFRRSEPGRAILDVGAQYCPYYPLFKDTCGSYTSLDIVDTPIVDVVCNAEEMSLGDNLFDLVLCTQVLEHCQNPQKIVDECHRVLRPGGTLILTVPSIFPHHGYPADNWRFMPDGVRHLLRAFASVEVLGELDLAESLASVNCYYGHVFLGKVGRLGRILAPGWNLATNLFGRALSPLLRPFARSNFNSFTMNLWAEARK
jgi:SAM-dependent methyltransferase